MMQIEKEGPVPAPLTALLQKCISETLYPQEKYPRQWFPDLDDELSKLFKQTWQSDERFRKELTAAAPAQGAVPIEKLLCLASILEKHPQTLVMIYRRLITGFIRRLHRRQEEREDILQELLTRILADKIFRIQKKYKANFSQMPSFTSYFMVCVRNIYVDIVREGRFLMLKREAEPMKHTEPDLQAAMGSPLQNALLEEEYAKLRSILQLHPASAGKIILCLKLKFRLAIQVEDVKRCFPNCSLEDIAQLCHDFRTLKDRELYKTIVPVFNRHEENPVQPDTLRKWIENKTSLFILLLNRMHQGTVYNSKNIGDLLSLFLTGQVQP